jgi:hypothetical protein
MKPEFIWDKCWLTKQTEWLMVQILWLFGPWSGAKRRVCTLVSRFGRKKMMPGTTGPNFEFLEKLPTSNLK